MIYLLSLVYILNAIFINNEPRFRKIYSVLNQISHQITLKTIYSEIGDIHKINFSTEYHTC